MIATVLGAVLPLNHKGYEVAYTLAAAAFLVALTFGLVPTHRFARIALALAYPVAAIVFFSVHTTPGMNAAGWFAILKVGVVGWVAGFVLSHVVRRGWHHVRRQATPT